jgi:hypothetical protein
MASFSQGFLSQLGNPAMTQSLFDLGTAVGNVPAQYTAKRKRAKVRTANEGIMDSIYAQNPDDILEAARVLNRSGNDKDRIRAVELTQIAQKMQKQQAATAAQDVMAEFATKAGTKLRDRETREVFFKLARQNNLSVTEADTLYKMFLDQITSAKEIQKAGIATTRVDSEGNYYRYQIVTYKDGTSEPRLFPFEGSPETPVGRTVPASGSSGGNVQQQLRDTIAEEKRTVADTIAKEKRTAERVALADKLRPGNALAEQSAKDFATLRVEAAAKIPGLRDSAKNIDKIITLLRSPDLETGGFNRQVARGFTKFLGTEPANVGEFETRAGEVVLAKLQSFVGAISEGERAFLIEQIGSYLSSGESNIGRLIPLLEQAQALINNSVLIASSSSFESYLDKVLPSAEETTPDPDYSRFPADKRQDIQKAVNDGTITFEQAVEFYGQ